MVTERSRSDKIAREHVARRMPSGSIGPRQTHLGWARGTLDVVASIAGKGSRELARLSVRSRSKIENR